MLSYVTSAGVVTNSAVMAYVSSGVVEGTGIVDAPLIDEASATPRVYAFMGNANFSDSDDGKVAILQFPKVREWRIIHNLHICGVPGQWIRPARHDLLRRIRQPSLRPRHRRIHVRLRDTKRRLAEPPAI